MGNLFPETHRQETWKGFHHPMPEFSGFQGGPQFQVKHVGGFIDFFSRCFFFRSTFLPAYWLIAILVLILKPSKSKTFLKESQRKTNPLHLPYRLFSKAGRHHHVFVSIEASTLKIPSGPGRVLKNQIRYGRRGIFLMSREPVEMVEPFFRWWFQRFLIFIHTWGNDPIWRAYFSKGLVQPPTRFDFPKHVIWVWQNTLVKCCGQQKFVTSNHTKYCWWKRSCTSWY